MRHTLVQLNCNNVNCNWSLDSITEDNRSNSNNLIINHTNKQVLVYGLISLKSLSE